MSSFVPLLVGLSACAAVAAFMAFPRRRKPRGVPYARYAAAVGTLVSSALPLVVGLWPRAPIASGTVEKPGDHVALQADAVGRRQVIVKAELATKSDDLITAYIDGTSPPIVARLEHVAAGKKSRGVVHARVSTFRQDVIVDPGATALTLARVDGTERPLRLELVPRRPLAGPTTILIAFAAFLAVVVVAIRGGLAEVTIPLAGTALGFGLLAHGASSSPVRALLLGLFIGAPAGLMLGLAVGWPALKLRAPGRPAPRRGR